MQVCKGGVVFVCGTTALRRMQKYARGGIVFGVTRSSPHAGMQGGGRLWCYAALRRMQVCKGGDRLWCVNDRSSPHAGRHARGGRLWCYAALRRMQVCKGGVVFGVTPLFAACRCARGGSSLVLRRSSPHAGVQGGGRLGDRRHPAGRVLIGVTRPTAGSFHLSSPMVGCWMSVAGWTRHVSHGLRRLAWPAAEWTTVAGGLDLCVLLRLLACT